MKVKQRLCKILWYFKRDEIFNDIFLKDEAPSVEKQVFCKFSVFGCQFKVLNSLGMSAICTNCCVVLDIQTPAKGE